MVKKKKRRTSYESPTKDFRNVAQVAMGAGMVGMMTPLIQNPHVGSGNLASAGQGMLGMAMLAPIASVGFNAIDNISSKKKKKLM